MALNYPLDTHRIIADRIYVEPDRIYVNSNGIYLQLADQWLPIQRLSADEIGVFVTLDEIEMGVSRKSWTCSNTNCGYVNYDGINNCALCGASRYN